MQLKDILARGYFPGELPPPFKTKSFADHVTGSNVPLPKPSASSSKLCHHSLARHGSLRRRLGIPNPAHFLALCNELSTSWADIDAFTHSSPLSYSVPVPTPIGKRSLSLNLDFEALPALRANNRAVGRYLVVADISLFYHSIYTHSVPWALHTKSESKKRKLDKGLLGNRIDTALRNAQDLQTLGVPIGPDTSLLIAEIILCAVDLKIHGMCGARSIISRGMRSSDEYEFVLRNLSDAETVLSCIQQALSEFELSLNQSKTRLVEIPGRLDAAWILELTAYDIRDFPAVQPKDLIRYFDKVYTLVDEYPGDSVLRYALRKASTVQVHNSNSQLFQNLLLQCVSVDPAVLQDVLYILQKHQQRGAIINIDSIEQVINLQIQRHAPLGHSSEVSWAVWAAIAFNIPIDSGSAKVLSGTADSIVALLALDAQRRGLMHSDFDATTWQHFLTPEDLYGEQWLLTYEADCQLHLLPAGNSHVDKDPWFKNLKDAGVRFYDPSVSTLIPKPPALVVSGKLSP